MIIRVSYTTPGLLGRRHRDLTIPDGAVGVAAIAIESIPVAPRPEPFDRTVVRVRFPGSSREWCYRCVGGAQVGDRVAIGPNIHCSKIQIVRVVGLGRGGGYTGPLKTATLIPADDDGGIHAWDPNC